MTNLPERSDLTLPVGVVLTLACPVLCIVFTALGALMINPCGAFGDACDEAGGTTAVGRVMFALAGVAALGCVGGIVTVIVGLAQRRVKRRQS